MAGRERRVLKCFCWLLLSSHIKDRCISKSIAFVNASIQENVSLSDISAANKAAGNRSCPRTNIRAYFKSKISSRFDYFACSMRWGNVSIESDL